MPQADQAREHLTDYERAVCYYTIPRVVHPVTYGLIAAYALCLSEAIAVLVIGLVINNATWTTAGTVALFAIIVFGLAVFMLRALLNEVRQKRAIAIAHSTPDAADDLGDLPDPFDDHILLVRPQAIAWGKLVPVTSNDDSIAYFLDSAPDHGWWKLASAEDEEIMRVRAAHAPWYLRWLPGAPTRLTVEKDTREVGTITRHLGLTSTYVEVESTADTPVTYHVRAFGIYADEKLVGRIYALREAYYLDLRKDHVNDALLGYFITLE